MTEHSGSDSHSVRVVIHWGGKIAFDKIFEVTVPLP